MSSNEDSKWYLSWESENAWNLDTHFVAEEAFYLFTSLKLNFSSAIFQSWEPFQATKAGIFSDKSSHHRRKKVSEWHENAQLHATYQSIINLSTRIFCKTLQVKKKKKKCQMQMQMQLASKLLEDSHPIVILPEEESASI